MGLLYEGMAASVVIFAVSAGLVHAQYQKEWWLLLALISSGWWITRRQAAIDSAGVNP
ncbi:MAG: hypothetical protein HOP29_12200 [Phycisphaerales bacterium]|nr:hypothetical protein [Phycisphaerales bacterium]